MTTFQLGQVVSTPAALELIPSDVILASLARHLRNDWGDCTPEDAQANDDALKTGGRLLSVYHHNDTKFWIITEADRSSTCVLLPEDY